ANPSRGEAAQYRKEIKDGDKWVTAGNGTIEMKPNGDVFRQTLQPIPNKGPRGEEIKPSAILDKMDGSRMAMVYKDGSPTVSNGSQRDIFTTTADGRQASYSVKYDASKGQWNVESATVPKDGGGSVKLHRNPPGGDRYVIEDGTRTETGN